MAEREDVAALAEELWLADDYDLSADPDSRTARELRPEYEAKARTILASSWLAAHDERVRADERLACESGT